MGLQVSRPAACRRRAAALAVAAFTPLAVFSTAGPAEAATGAAGASAAPPCTVDWTGGASKSDWNIAANWSDDKVPGPSSDVCVTTGVYTYVFATGHIVVHSLFLDGDGGLEIGETGGANKPSSFDVTSLVDNEGSIGLYSSALDSPKITSFNLFGNGPAGSGGTSTLTSADFTNTGFVGAEEGTLTITDTPVQLHDGTLSGGQWDAIGNPGTVLDLPEGITHLASGTIGMVNGGLVMSGGSNAVAKLQTIGSGAGLDIAGNTTPVSLSGDLSSAGEVNLGGYDSSGSLRIEGYLVEDSGGETTLSGGSSLQATGVHLEPGSSLTGGDQAVVEANVDNSGAVGVDATVMKIEGTYLQTPSGVLEAGNGFEIQTSSYVEISGALDTPPGVPPPAPGTRSVAMTFASRNGDFSSVTLGFRLAPEDTRIDVVAQPQVELSSTSVTPGEMLGIDGGDFPYGSTARLYLDHAGGTPLATPPVDEHGFFAASVVVPSGTSKGRHEIVATDKGLTVTARLTVT